MSPQLEISGSILDVGFINHKTNIKNTKVEGDFVYEGVNFTFDSDNPRNYWGEIENQSPINFIQNSHIQSMIYLSPTLVQVCQPKFGMLIFMEW